MDDKEDKPKRRWPTYLAVGLVLVVYPLSIGPAYVLLDYTGEPMAILKAYNLIYTPLFWICESTGTNRWLGDYLQWWAAW
jgi:hypothetical protein